MNRNGWINFNISWKRGWSFILTLCLLLSLFWPWAGESAAGAAADTSYKSVGYYTDWATYDQNYQVEHIDASKLTHLNYAFADICWNGIHGNPSNAPDNPNKQTWPCKNSGVPTQKGTVPNGAIVLGDPWADVNNSDGVPLEWELCEKGQCGNFYKLKQLKAAHPHLKILLSVGGWSWSNRFSDTAADPSARQNFANSAVTIIRTYGFDGIDIDWEYPVEGGLSGNNSRPADKQNFTSLLQETRNKLNAAGTADGRAYLLTIATRANSSYLNTTEITQVANLVDWMNIMTYDFHGDWEKRTNNNAPLYSDPRDPDNNSGFNVDYAIHAYKQAGVPSGKIVLGLALYGRGWKNCAPGPGQDGLYQSCTPDFNGNYIPRGTWDTFETGATGMFDYGDLKANYMNKNGYARYWNDAAKVPYLFQASTGTYISYDDLDSTSYKTAYMKSQGLGGAMLWDLSLDCRTSPKYQCVGESLLGRVASDLGIVPSGSDLLPPTTPSNLSASSITSVSTKLSWSASQDNVGVSGYDVYNGTVLIGTANGTTYTVSGLLPDTTYTFSVRAKDAAGNVSPSSSSVAVQTLPASSDTSPPTAPKTLTSSSVTDTSVTLAWSGATDNVGIAAYELYNGSALAATVTDTTYTLIGLAPNTSYSFQVKARDAVGNASPLSKKLTVKTLAQNDTQAPTPPANVTAAAHTDTTITLSWSASADNVGVTGYVVTVNGAAAAVTSGTGTSYTLTGLAPSTNYTIAVAARDGAGNQSAGSPAITVTTDPVPVGGAWAPNKAYAVGNEVTYSGVTYVCNIAHTSLVGWEPPAVPALWKKK
ncbi:glycosyl hydrolase family 18 protein [Paenibacillus sp. UMB4589-SE434]|uniref:glycosyl hydrolase family 18 protein n=1 Tax=Paenibacillus sp. UMB4589-SE434 TaxID=3046314 RepID=UPI00254B9237|nr:glycosyl hydrolase family 18 protein [Paenibacillus sp. UMB4589-SE434]MDK8181828.1 glycosyl hydrolase family 18 protein [Paenibacillus sp. UMB4589-SE434]